MFSYLWFASSFKLVKFNRTAGIKILSHVRTLLKNLKFEQAFTKNKHTMDTLLNIYKKYSQSQKNIKSPENVKVVK